MIDNYEKYLEKRPSLINYFGIDLAQLGLVNKDIVIDLIQALNRQEENMKELLEALEERERDVDRRIEKQQDEIRMLKEAIKGLHSENTGADGYYIKCQCNICKSLTPEKYGL